ncbi:conjugative transposon protein TraM [Pedobacter sp. ISL-68]|uniref:conjugative transposon protein TraM n=1 Tax=unclassified Pedobacter TaxID=2628915 RepID=UPI001BE6AFD7|nr:MULTISPECIES: conjugative transposon protein TraM [unclassified Pedobacter]MBT2564656.1 conjugative transposon protein TraM [Pedobacter sp. ISL-64]MBT2593655.1 conjugative transposon protein TraM [Pedobacter sp. ISL-68]
MEKGKIGLKRLFDTSGKSEAEKKKFKQRALLMLVAVVAVCSIGLWLVVKDSLAKNELAQKTKKGINASLPDAVLKKDVPGDKMSIYSITPMDTAGKHDRLSGLQMSLKAPVEDAQIGAIRERLKSIDQQINAPVAVRAGYVPAPVGFSSSGDNDTKGDVDRLEKLMQTIQQGKREDKEMDQLSEMMDKIIAVQNPGLMQEKMLARKTELAKKDSAFRAVPAVVEGRQKVIQGGLVKLRLLDTVSLNGMLLPKDQLLFGSCTIVNQRLLLDITNVRLGSSIVPVQLSVFSLDGIIGIDAPEAVLGETAGNGVSNAVQSMQFLSMDQSLGIQAAGAGIDAAKSLIGKRAKRIRVKLKDRDPVLLRINRY